MGLSSITLSVTTRNASITDGVLPAQKAKKIPPAQDTGGKHQSHNLKEINEKSLQAIYKSVASYPNSLFKSNKTSGSILLLISLSFCLF